MTREHCGVLRLALEKQLARLSNPESGFVRSTRLAESAFCGFSFANAWVTYPALTTDTAARDLPLMPVSGHARSPETALQILLMEAAERHSSVFDGSEQLHLAECCQLPRFELDSLLQYSRRQQCSRSDALPIDDPWWAPEQLPCEFRIRWKEAVSLSTKEKCFVPAGSVYLGYGAEDEPLYVIADSSGCAAAPTHNEAAYRALLEVMERDALGIWWYNRVSRPAFDFAADSLLASIGDALRKIGRTLELIDIGNDLPSAAVVAYSADRDGRRIYLGCAADICSRRAAVRAASEMLQFWFWGAVSRDPPGRAAWLESESLQTQPWLKPTGLRRLPEAATEEPVTETLNQLVTQLAIKGYDPLMVDLTRPAIGVPVVRILVPGLRSHLPHFGTGRLFDVPQRLGWVSERRKEEELFRRVCPI